MTTPQIRILESLEAVSRAASEEFVRLARAAVDARGVFTVALAGGSTPRHMYRLLAEDPNLRQAVPWGEIEFFWGDERHVPPDHADSNYRMAHEAMLSRAPVPASHVHRILAENADAARAAADYETELRAVVGRENPEIPRLDLVLLGMGPDGHTASLFPSSEGLRERTRLVVANWVEKFRAYRITMTYPILNAAACVAFVVTGGEKADVLRTILGDSGGATPFPAQLVRPVDGRLIWLLDRAAGQHLPQSLS